MEETLHYIDIDGVLFTQPPKEMYGESDDAFAEAVKQQKLIPEIYEILKVVKGVKFFCTGRKYSKLGKYTENQIRQLFGPHSIEFYPENREYRPWEIYNIFKLITLETEVAIMTEHDVVPKDIYVWEDSIWVIQTIIKYTTIPLNRLRFKFIHTHNGKYYVSDVFPEDVIHIVETVEGKWKK